MLDTLSNLLAVLIALSVAAERLVEILKNLVPYLRTEQAAANAEARRKLVLQLLAVAAGIATAFLAETVLPTRLQDPRHLVLLGLLASGGSGFWTSILGYVTSVKNVGQVQAAQQNLTLAAHAARLARGHAPAPAALLNRVRPEAAEPAPEATLPPQPDAVIQAADENLRRAIALANAIR